MTGAGPGNTVYRARKGGVTGRLVDQSECKIEGEDQARLRRLAAGVAGSAAAFATGDRQ